MIVHVDRSGREHHAEEGAKNPHYPCGVYQRVKQIYRMNYTQKLSLPFTGCPETGVTTFTYRLFSKP